MKWAPSRNACLTGAISGTSKSSTSLLPGAFISVPTLIGRSRAAAMRTISCSLATLSCRVSGIGDVPVAVGDDVERDRALADQQIEQLVDGLFARGCAVQPGGARQRAAGDDHGVELGHGREGLRAGLDITHAAPLHQLAADQVRELGIIADDGGDLLGRSAQLLGPEGRLLAFCTVEGPICGADVREEHVALGGVARGGQRQDIALVVDDHRIQVGVHPRRPSRGCAGRRGRAWRPASARPRAARSPM